MGTLLLRSRLCEVLSAFAYPNFQNVEQKGKEELGKEEGAEGNLQRLRHVRPVANPGIQGSFQHDRPESDGFIDKTDLQDMFASLGKEPKEDYIDKMMGEATGPINFTMFLTLYGEK